MKVLKIDRPVGGGFLGLTAPLAPRVVVSPLDSAFGAEGSEGSKGSG